MAITTVVLAAGILEIVVSVGAYLAKVKEEVSMDVRRSMDLSTRAVATLRNTVQNMELAWNEIGPEERRTAKEFRDAGGVLRVQATLDHPPMLVLGSDSAADPTVVERYVRLSEKISAATVVIAARNGGELTAYVFSPDRQVAMLSVLPWAGSAWQNALATNRNGLYSTLMASGAADVPTPEGGWRDAKTGLPRFQWLPPYKSPLTGRLSVRIATELVGQDGRAFGTLVYELPVSALAATLPSTRATGSCALMGGDGSQIVTCLQKPAPEVAPFVKEAISAGLGRSANDFHLGGFVLSGWPLGTTGWTLVNVMSWRDIVVGVRSQLVLSSLTSILIIVLTWTLLLTVKRRVFLPAIRQSERVFESEQLSRTLIETAPVGLGVIAIDGGQPLLRSPTMIETADRVQVGGPSLSYLLSQHYLQRSLQANAAAGGAFKAEDDLTFTTRDGQRIDLAVSMARARYQGQAVMVTAFADITAKKQLEQELHRARQAAESANAAKSAFLAAMSHEIRTPLNAVLGNLELLAHSPLDKVQRDRLRTIRTSSEGLLAIVSDILDFSKIEAGELVLENVVFDLLEVVSGALRIFMPVAHGKGVALVGELGAAITQPMRGDSLRLAQVINNLLSNAIKFTESGQVTLRVSVDEIASQAIIEVEDTGIGMSATQLSRLFREYSQADAATSRQFGGTGLGLALCRRLVMAMKGEVTATSELAHGSRFTVRLPLGQDAGLREVPSFHAERVLVVAASEDGAAMLDATLRTWGLRVSVYRHPALVETMALETAAALILWGDRRTWHPEDENRLVEESSWVLDCREDGPAEPLATGRVVSVSVYGMRSLATALRHALQGEALDEREQDRRVLAKRLRVLVAEDNAVNRKLFDEQLKLLGCDTTTVPNAEQALAQLERETFDVLLTDLSMPGMDGFALARQVRLRWPSLPVLAATANVTPHEREQGALAGMAQVLGKPLSLRQLGQALSEATGLPQLKFDAGVDGTLLNGGPLPEEVKLAFVQSCETALIKLRQGLHDEDAGCLLSELHSVEGACRVFKFQDMAQQCAMLSRLIPQRGVLACAAEIHVLCDMLQAIAQPDPGLLRNLCERIISLAESDVDHGENAEIAALARVVHRALGDRSDLPKKSHDMT